MSVAKENSPMRAAETPVPPRVRVGVCIGCKRKATHFCCPLSVAEMSKWEGVHGCKTISIQELRHGPIYSIAGE